MKEAIPNPAYESALPNLLGTLADTVSFNTVVNPAWETAPIEESFIGEGGKPIKLSDYPNRYLTFEDVRKGHIVPPFITVTVPTA